jgi:TrmH family RNA methyltransferase
MITSLSNDKVKLARSLARRRGREREQRFIVEGVRMLGEAIRRGVEPDFVFYTASVLENEPAADLIAALARQGVACYQVSEEVLQASADTVTPSGLLAVVPFIDVPSVADPGWFLLVDNIRDPGNLGAILRTAAAAGVDQVLLSPGTVDYYNPKVVRGGAGTHFFLPAFSLSWDEIRARLSGVEVWLAAVQDARPYTAADWSLPMALVIGSEAHGGSSPARDLSTQRVTIPMVREVESLNAAVAAGVLLFEMAQHRSITKESGR